MIRDAFINGLKSNHIRQRLLENKTLNLQTAIDQAHSLDVAQQSSTMFSQPSIPEVVAPMPRREFEKCSANDTSLAAVNCKGKQNTQSCWFCGNSRHLCNKCSAKGTACHKCFLTGKCLEYVKQSAISDHLLQCNWTINFDDFSILATDCNKFKLLLRESLLIKRDKPI